MLTRAAKNRRVLIWTAGLLIGAGLLGPISAEAACGAKWRKRAAKLGSCQPPKTIFRLQNKTCPANKHRPPIVVTRACCENRKGKVQCHPFPTCPSRSPS